MTLPLHPASTRALRSSKLPAWLAFPLLASITISFLAGSIAPTPLYAVYQAAWGFSPITTTVVFGVYAVAVLAALLVFGALSDHVGRRPVLLIAVLVQAVTMLLFTSADGVGALLAARIVQGLSTGAALGAVGAGMLDIDRARGTLVNAIAPMLGTASGALGAGLMIQFLPAPTHLVYLVLGALFVVQALGVALMAETASPRPGALASLRPKLGVPAAARRPVLLAVPVLVAAWALVGFYGSLGPLLVRQVVEQASFLTGGLTIFTLAASGAVTVLLLRRGAPRAVMVLGIVGLIGGVGTTLLALVLGWAPAFFAGTALAGAGFGAGFQGAIRTVVPLAAAHERAGLLSVLYMVSYLAMGVPAVLAGYLVVHGGGVRTTALEYGAGIMALAAIALVGRGPRVSISIPADQIGSGRR